MVIFMDCGRNLTVLACVKENTDLSRASAGPVASPGGAVITKRGETTVMTRVDVIRKDEIGESEWFPGVFDVR